MPSNIATDVRAALATALSGVAANVYSYVPETVTPPAVAILYTDPMMELLLINKSSTKVKLNFVISAAVAYNSNRVGFTPIRFRGRSSDSARFRYHFKHLLHSNTIRRKNAYNSNNRA